MAKAGLLFVGTDDGMTLYSEPGAMGRWLRVGQELRGNSIQSVWVWADNPIHILAASDNQLFRSEDGGSSWNTASPVAGGFLAGGRAAQSQLWCLASDSTLWQSSDAGGTWDQLAGFSMPGAQLIVSATDRPEYLAIAAGSHIMLSDTAGVQWQQLPDLPGDITQLVFGNAETTLYAIVNNQLFGYSNAAWHTLAPSFAATGGLAILAGREPVLLAATLDAGIARSSDVGATWETSSNETGWQIAPPVIVAVPYHMDTAFAGAGSAVAISSDRGRTWQRLKGDLPTVRAIASARLV